jgi:DNA-directed RNA polymerase specialized sigma24 family protein
MASSHSVTHWIGQLRAGDQVAAQHLWEGYFRRLVGLARGKLQSLPSRVADEEDVALSAFASFCRGVERGRFPQLADRDNLWRLLVTITARKALHLARDERSQKRGGGAVRDATARGDRDGSAAEDAAIDELLGREPTPEFAFQVAEEYQRLLESLGDADLRKIAVWKMEGYTTEDIAAKLGRAPRTVERKLDLIRQRWTA